MNILFGNYGDNTLALLQWAKEHDLANVSMVSVDTGWGAQGWDERVKQAEAVAKSSGFHVVRLISKPSFQDLMLDRKEFPSQKFQWCAGFLKGLVFLDWLDEQDPRCMASIILGKRRLDSRAQHDLPEFIEESEHFGDRKVWYPLCQHNDAQFDELIAKTGLERLHHRSLECDPCVNNQDCDFLRLQKIDEEKVKQLEVGVGRPMFTFPIEKMLEAVKNKGLRVTVKSGDSFNMGCGSPFGCGE